MIDSTQSTSTRPYLLRALYEWCADNGLTPYVAAYVDESVKVPREHVKNNEIVLNISMDATSHLQISNDFLQFKARFGGVAREIVVPIDHVIAIYARESGQGMAFPAPLLAQLNQQASEKSPTHESGLHPVQMRAEEQAQTPPLSAADAPDLKTSSPIARIVRLGVGEKEGKAKQSVAQNSQDKPTGKPTLTRVK